MKHVIFFLALITAMPMWALATEYTVGPGKMYAELDEVPWQSLLSGDTVSIYWREAPYKGKFVLCRVGMQSHPIVIRGVAAEDGSLPVIDGDGATTSSELNFWNEERGIIKIGGANKPVDAMPAYIRIESLDIRTGRPGYYFTGRNGLTEYVQNCAAVYIEKGKHITISKCILHDCGNGVFAGSQTEDLVIEYCSIYDNGIEGDMYEHNTYTEANGIIYQYNHFGSLRAGCLGNNLKDRSAGTIIRYNWIENGNRQLDLVDSGSEELRALDIYRKTYVYGNILIEADGEGNSQIIHYGGDSNDESRYRKGTLFLYNNTIVSTRTGNTTLIRMPTEDETCTAFNNVFYVTADPSTFALVSTDNGVLHMENNFIRPGWVTAHGTTQVQTDITGTIEADDPGFVDIASQDFTLVSASPCIDAGIGLPASVPVNYTPVEEYRKHASSRLRAASGMYDIGAYEFDQNTSVGSIPVPSPELLDISPNPFHTDVRITAGSPQNIRIYDTRGAVVKEYSFQQRGVQTVTWQPDSALPAGIYYIRVLQAAGEVTKPVVYTR